MNIIHCSYKFECRQKKKKKIFSTHKEVKNKENVSRYYHCQGKFEIIFFYLLVDRTFKKYRFNQIRFIK
jgi:hypothetical protein